MCMCVTWHMLVILLKMTSFNSQTCWTPGEQIIKYYFKILSRNYWYFTASLMTTARHTPPVLSLLVQYIASDKLHCLVASTGCNSCVQNSVPVETPTWPAAAVPHSSSLTNSLTRIHPWALKQTSSLAWDQTDALVITALLPQLIRLLYDLWDFNKYQCICWYYGCSITTLQYPTKLVTQMKGQKPYVSFICGYAQFNTENFHCGTYL